MDTWTALILSRETTRELQRDAAQHRLAKLAAASPTASGWSRVGHRAGRRSRPNDRRAQLRRLEVRRNRKLLAAALQGGLALLQDAGADGRGLGDLDAGRGLAGRGDRVLPGARQQAAHVDARAPTSGVGALFDGGTAVLAEVGP